MIIFGFVFVALFLVLLIAGEIQNYLTGKKLTYYNSKGK